MFFDIDRVEVLKGSQGTLYGRNATGGAINVLPTKPKLNSTSGYINGSFGNYNAVAVQSAINLPLGPTAALRVSGNIARHDGYYSTVPTSSATSPRARNCCSGPHPTSRSALPAIITMAATRAAARTSAATRSSTRRQTAIPSCPPDWPITSTPTTRALRHSWRPPCREFRPAGLLPLRSSPHQDYVSWGVNADISYTMPCATLTITPAYREFHQKSVEASGGFSVDQNQTFKTHSLEARWASDAAARIGWMLGGFYYKENVEAPRMNVLTEVLDSFQPFRQDTTSLAVFGRVTAHLTDQLRIVGGGRYTHDRRTFAGTADVLVDACVAPAHSCPNAPLLPFATSVADTAAQLGRVATPYGFFVQPGNPGAAAIVAWRALADRVGPTR